MCIQVRHELIVCFGLFLVKLIWDFIDDDHYSFKSKCVGKKPDIVHSIYKVLSIWTHNNQLVFACSPFTRLAKDTVSPVCVKGVHVRLHTADIQPLRKTKVRGKQLVGGISIADVKHAAGLLCFIALLKQAYVICT